MIMNDSIKLIIPCKPEYVGTVRLTISSVASKAGFDVEAIEDMKIAVSEVCSNIIRHSKLNEKDQYHVTCELADGKLVILVEDEGAGFDTDKYVEYDEEKLGENGLGLTIVRALMDEVNLVSKAGSGTQIRMTKYISASE